MNGRILLPLISLICVVLVLYLLSTITHVHTPAENMRPAESMKPLLLPYAEELKSIDDIQQALWTTHLHQFLLSLNKSISPQLNMVFGDSDHMDLVLNWVIAAHVRLDPPLHNIMVLSVDQPLCNFLASKKLPVTCIAVPPQSFLAYPGPKSWVKGLRSRLIVLRMINIWGYDVASYDSDAVLLRNPQHFYDSNPDVKFFAGSGTFPLNISDHWGFTICSCVLMLRNHSSLENLWRNIHRTNSRKSEQAILNYALHNLGMRWERTTTVKNICNIRSGWRSYKPLYAIVFSQEDFCRGCCGDALKHHYYLLHPVTKHQVTNLVKRIDKIKALHGWFLRDNWRDVASSSLEGELWLRNISTLSDG